VVKVVDIIGTIDAILQPSRLKDGTPNGLQVPGKPEIDRLVTGVSPSVALFERAVELDAGLVLCHHGLFWGETMGVSPVELARLRVLLRHDIAFAAYHLPLDAHPEIGNNALLAGLLGCEDHEAFGDVGRLGTFGGDGIAIEDLLARVRETTGREPLHQGRGPQRVRRLGIVSGGAASMLADAVAAGCDAFLTGEPKENVMGDATDSGIHFIAAGHYATETFGIRRLGELIAEQHGVEHVFVDVPNPV
jgi:dinuclear metal center YbgI/SA1388 family protein